ncbi:MAG: RIP metalloprotease RseP [Bacteroidota bacterium]
MEGIIMAAQIILSLSILVGLHELGHLIAAKVFGMRVEKYSIGFPPKIFGFQYGETEYSIGAIPLGGYVKISGMIDESMDKEAMAQPPKDYEFRSKPAWQRLIVMMGGIIVNVITGIFIFIAIVYSYGERFYTMEEVNKHGIRANEIAIDMGLQTGDKIIGINENPVARFDELTGSDILLGTDVYYNVSRNGETINIPVPEDLIERLSDKKNKGLFIQPLIPYEVGEVSKDSEAERMGLKEGDRIISINETKVTYFNDFDAVKLKYINEPIELKIERNGEILMLSGTLPEDGMIGFMRVPLIESSFEQYTLGQAVVKGTDKAFEAVWVNMKGLGKMISGKIDPTKSIMGPIGIAQIFGGTWDWERFWHLTGLLSMILAFMNFLPIPALDGGHVMFLSYEIVSGRAPGDKFLEVAQKVGMIFLLALMAFVIGNDILKLF